MKNPYKDNILAPTSGDTASAFSAARSSTLRQPREVMPLQRERTPCAGRPGGFLISLDFELHWGVRDMVRLDAAERARLLAARDCVPRILDLFEEFSVHATWATVGFLFAYSRLEAEAFRPAKLPSYRNARLDPYREHVGTNERDDPFHFAASLVARIAERKGQEIASHSFSHYYSMEAGQSVGEFEADLQSAVAIAANSGYAIKSYVFPRNQANSAYLPALKRAGIQAYRGNELVSTKSAAAFAEQRRPHKRILRLLDSYVNLDGDQTFPWPDHPEFSSIPASRYLRSYHPAFRPFEDLLLRRIRRAMEHAAKSGEIFHLWWHPEDFARDPGQNLRILRQVLEAFDHYRAQYGMVSHSMSEVLSEPSAERFLEAS